MTALLTAAAVITTLLLVVSATHTATTASASDSSDRGPWAIVSWTSTHNRPLDPHERRWQTWLLSGKDNRSRWQDVVAQIQALERLQDTTDTLEPPPSFSAAWIEDSIANLERSIDERAHP